MEKIINFIKRYHLFFLLIIVLTSELLFRNILESNEADTLVYAKHFMNKNWITNDWYLNLGIGYRYLFNFFAGTLALIFPLWIVSIIGRIIIILIFSYLFYKIGEHFKVNSCLMVFFATLYCIFPSLTAGEWFLRYFETKVFSYFFSILSIYFLMKKSYIKMFLSLGLSLSFHVLIGLYSCFCLFFTVLLNIKYFKNDLISLVKASFIFPIAGIFGIYFIITNIISNTDKKISHFASIVYVKLRVAHHTLPSSWDKNFFFYFIIIIIFLLFIYLFSKKQDMKIMSSFGLMSAVLFLIGLIIYLLGNINLLKFYWFRLPDVMLTFISFLLITIIINNFLNINTIKNIKINYLIKLLNLLIIITASFLVFFKFKDTEIYFNNKNKNYEVFYLDNNIDYNLFDVLKWVNINSNKNDTFLSDPYFERFYVFAQRSQFVSFKHSPQSEIDIFEWYKRMHLANNTEIKDYDHPNKFEKNFYNLNEETINKIHKKYNIDYYIGKTNKNYSYPVIYKNDEYAIYSLK
ncbi:MAG: hypothetical protein JXB50_14870 [Spirochaetes bacterium]|nr:hypothetical protein [Spirochaetota bacterium]